MPAEGAAEGRSLMILTEGGQLVIHDLLHWQPQPLTLPAQELPPITVSKLVPTVNAEQQGEPGGSAAVSPRSPSAASVGLPSPSPLDPGPLSAQSCPAGPAAPLPQHALTLDRVRACSRRLASVPSGGAGQEPSVLEHWPFSGGQPAASLAESGGGRRHPSALFFSGHRDGGSAWGWRAALGLLAMRALAIIGYQPAQQQQGAEQAGDLLAPAYPSDSHVPHENQLQVGCGCGTPPPRFLRCCSRYRRRWARSACVL